jgi:ribosome-binding protein aMBF1 (putative translation factor)
MAKGHTYFWRRPGRRDEERKTFAALMRKVEAVRLRSGMSKMALAAELETTTDAVRAWMTGRTIGRKETIAKIETFLKKTKIAKGSDIAG